MDTVRRYPNNPFLGADKENTWEGRAVFNGCPVKFDHTYHLVYRALSLPQIYRGKEMNLSSIGYAKSTDGLMYTNRKLLIEPENEWEAYGCEDPRMTRIDGKYYILYTALADFPHTPQGIRVAVAITEDFSQIEEKHLVTTFNSKAMALFPEKINGKYAAILTVNTDNPPSQIAIAQFDRIEDMWTPDYWDNWHRDLDPHTLHLTRTLHDHVEVGAPPIRTDYGWLIVYSHIQGYNTTDVVFGIEVALLDLNDPTKVIAKLKRPLLKPEEHYELHGDVPNIVFPSGAIIENQMLYIYYGAADTSCCFAAIGLDCLFAKLRVKQHDEHCPSASDESSYSSQEVRLERFEGNPIIEPNPENEWESTYTLNPTAVYDNGVVSILYRAQNQKGTSVVGLATSKDGIHIDKRYPAPIYVPRESFEMTAGDGASGCEDARITKMGDRMYLCYTAYAGVDPTHIGFSSISVEDFRAHKWDKWEKPKVISPERYDKNACLVSEKVHNGTQYCFFHRMDHMIWVDYVDNLEFRGGRVLSGKVLMEPRQDSWDSKKIGIAGPPIRVEDGWVLIYHALSKYDGKYRLSAALLDENCSSVRKRLAYPILEPEAPYEMSGLRPGTVFSCGQVVIDGILYVYYGGADQFVAVATTEFEHLLWVLRK